ncbi:hypothetical protein C2G38_2290068 [Gigaspora rosea]|uniref:Uncharacterized protein n=1 Tax=Gigaspora rosea TaxID=44941 RepID=A0A397U626_9GLOM|nr:hypothetical protein C2G38_2290068 [Gigaspora rosea]
MNNLSFPENVRKTIVTLQRQLQNEEMSETFSISSEKVTYNNPLPNEINVVTPRRLTDAQRIHLKIPKFLEDLQRRGETTLQLEEAIGNTCLEQIRFLCESLSQTDLNPNISLQYYYLLGEKSNTECWESEIQRKFPTKFRNVQKAAQQIYNLYTYRGLPNLLVTQTITPNALARMYDEDFNLLLQEARTQRFQENAELIYLYDTFAGAQVQEGEYVGI